MIRNRRWLVSVSVALLVAALQCTPAAGGAGEDKTWTQVRGAQVREVKRRVEEINAAISELVSTSESAGEEVDMKQLAGRDSFITWALSMIATLEEQGSIVRDDDFVRAAGEGFEAGRLSPGTYDSTMLFEALEKLQAEKALPVLTEYVITMRSPLVGGLSAMRTRHMFPACAALAAIGEPSLPAMLSNIKGKHHPPILKNSAWVIGTVLGEDALAYWDEQIRLETDPSVKKKLESVTWTVQSCAHEAKVARLEREKTAKRKGELKERELKAEVFE